MVTTATTPRMTVDEFFEWTARPENAGRRWELVRGEVVEMPSPGYLHGVVCAIIAHILMTYAGRRGRGIVATNDTRLVVNRVRDTTRGVDVMFIDEVQSFDSISPGPVTGVPALAVEVYSPSDRPGRLSQRIGDYFAHGVPLVWVVYPEEKVVDVYRPGRSVEAHTVADTLSGYDALLDFSCPVADVFRLPGTSA